MLGIDTDTVNSLRTNAATFPFFKFFIKLPSLTREMAIINKKYFYHPVYGLGCVCINKKWTRLGLNLNSCRKEGEV